MDSEHKWRYLFRSSLQGNRNEDPDVDPDAAKADAQALLEAGKIVTWLIDKWW